MAQISDDCFAFGGDLMSERDARALIRERISPITAREQVALKAARGRILATPLVAAQPVPAFDNAAVDGYAVFFADLRPDAPTDLKVKGRATAGHPWLNEVRRGEAVRIFTGAAMPNGPDTVLMQEDCLEKDGVVRIKPGIRRGANRRLAGEDLVAGSLVLAPGRRMKAAEIGLAASMGLTSLPLFRRVRVALFSTGDEVREPGEAVSAGTLYDSNRFVLAALLEGLQCEVSDLGILPDDPGIIRETLRAEAPRHDLIITSGGMSTGEEDHVKAAIEALGRLHFWRLSIKPGRPVAMGQIGAVPFMGLPGNPVAVMVCFLVLTRPLLERLSGATMTEPRLFRLTSGFDYKKRANRCEYIRVRLKLGEHGEWIAEKFPRDGAGILSSMTWSEGLVVLAEGITSLAAGEPVAFLPFSEVME
ncbi:MAG TPA: gephyrin-like molybdotransferase Glp [Stellaceae bacterium]|nr:gephyrin-like molybdotransferase Glp [Stellaceae bacterium]